MVNCLGVWLAATRRCMKCQNETVTVELKNGTIFNGTITPVSPLVNVALRTIKYTPKDLDNVTLDTMTVRGSTVRYIILPDSLPLDTLLIDDTLKPKNKSVFANAQRGYSFKFLQTFVSGMTHST
ncbi:hypothetical protein G6514_004131 [Epicoccum nigrum]|nr:hypothetical protein G6514_004131 [Epicoccum nigrum]